MPYVCVLLGHNMDPARVVPAMAFDDRVAISDSCRGRARGCCETLHGWADVSPFSYYDAFSPHLNLAIASRPRS